MSFGEAFGKLIKRKRGVERLTQQELAVTAFGDESFKTRISELENGRISKPQAKTVDALILALNISDDELNLVLNESPSPRIVDNMCDFVDMDGAESVHIEVAIRKSGGAVVLHNRHLNVEIKRCEYFLEERMLVFLEASGRRRPAGIPLTEKVHQHLVKYTEIEFIYFDDETMKTAEGPHVPLKIIP